MTLRASVCALLVLTVGGCASAPTPAPPPGDIPLYEGKPMEYWLGELRDLSAERSGAAGTALVAFGEPAVPHLGRMLEDPSPRVRSRASRALYQLGARAHGAAEALVVAAAGSDPDVRSQALMTIPRLLAAGVEVAGGREVLVAATRDPDPKVRRLGVWAIKECYGPRGSFPGGEEILLEATRDPEERVRDGALEGVGLLLSGGVEVPGGLEALEADSKARGGKWKDLIERARKGHADRK